MTGEAQLTWLCNSATFACSITPSKDFGLKCNAIDVGDFIDETSLTLDRCRGS